MWGGVGLGKGFLGVWFFILALEGGGGSSWWGWPQWMTIGGDGEGDLQL